MKKIFASLIILVFAAGILSGCGAGDHNKGKELKEKKAQLAKLQEQQEALNAQISKLQTEIGKLDPDFAVKPKLVSIDTIGTSQFDHFIDLQGKIDAQNIAYVSPRGAGGMVTKVLVKQGDHVGKGQTLAILDASVLRQQVTAAEQQLGGVKAQLDQAKSLYQRQQNLWKNNIGTEVQVLNAKTNMDALQSQYNAALANIKLAKEQLNTTNVTAEISGVVNTVNIKPGEFFSPGGQQIQIVNTTDLKVKANVPENYLDKVKAGSNMIVTLPELDNKTINTKVSVQGKMIDPTTRSFYVEGIIPANQGVTPNQVANVRIMDYSNNDAISVLLSAVQNDEKGKYVMLAVQEKGKLIAKKRAVEIGQLYGDKIEIKSGLQAGDVVITDGVQNLYDGQTITTESGK
jgi:RND family efflux transporter MFP subunit